MRVWYFSEMAYHPAWEEGLGRGTLRVVLPNRNFDPQVGHGLLNRYLDEFEFRYNNRKNAYLFRDVLVRLMESKAMPYETLTA